MKRILVIFIFALISTTSLESKVLAGPPANSAGNANHADEGKRGKIVSPSPPPESQAVKASSGYTENLPPKGSGISNNKDNNEPPNLKTVLLAGAVALLGSMVTAVITVVVNIVNPWLTWRLNENTRRFQLYQTFFLKKIEAYTEINKAFYEVYAYLHDIEKNFKREPEALKNKVDSLGAQVEVIAPFLREEIFAKLFECRQKLYQIVAKVEKGSTNIEDDLLAWDKSYQVINIEFRNELHVNVFSKLVRDNQRSGNTR